MSMKKIRKINRKIFILLKILLFIIIFMRKRGSERLGGYGFEQIRTLRTAF